MTKLKLSPVNRIANSIGSLESLLDSDEARVNDYTGEKISGNILSLKCALVELATQDDFIPELLKRVPLKEYVLLIERDCEDSTDHITFVLDAANPEDAETKFLHDNPDVSVIAVYERVR